MQPFFNPAHRISSFRFLLLAGKDRLNLAIAPRDARPCGYSFLVQLFGNGPVALPSFAVRLSAKFFDSLDSFIFARIVTVGFSALTSACFGPLSLSGFPQFVDQKPLVQLSNVVLNLDYELFPQNKIDL